MLWHKLLNVILKKMRKKRFQAFKEAFPDVSELTVLDIGGTRFNWDIMAVRPKKLVLLNLDKQEDGKWFECVAGNACDLGYKDNEFDLI